MQFRDLKTQYEYLRKDIDEGISRVINSTSFIGGQEVTELENQLSEYVGMKHCITCANGTDALQLALMAWNIGKGDAVFVPDFTFFSSGEVVSSVGALPVFVDVDKDTYNIDVCALEKMIIKTLETGVYTPKVIIAVDLFGQPADFVEINKIAKKYDLYILEDGAQGFGGRIGDKKACSFGDISTTSFFPAKPLGCYGDGGAIFTDNDEWAELMKSYKVHGKGANKYDNVRIGMNSRLDTIQAVILLAKLPVFINEELTKEQEIASWYIEQLKEFVKTPIVKEGYFSSWAQFTIQLKDKEQRDGLQGFLKKNEIPSMVYYQKPMHKQLAFKENNYDAEDYKITSELSEKVLSLPFHPYMTGEDVEKVTVAIKEYLK